MTTPVGCEIQDLAKLPFPGLQNFVTALAYHFCLNLPAAFSQPGNGLIEIPCTGSSVWSATWTPGGRRTKCSRRSGTFSTRKRIHRNPFRDSSQDLLSCFASLSVITAVVWALFCMAPGKLDEYHEHTIDAQGVPRGLSTGMGTLNHVA